MKLDKPKEIDSRAAKRAAGASPQMEEQEKLIRKTHLIIKPLKYLQSAAWIENVSIIANT
jgi:hypothetical protein